MTIYESLTFGSINLSNLEECYTTEIELNGRMVEVEMEFAESESIGHAPVQAVDEFLKGLIPFETKIRKFLQKDFRQGGHTRSYVDLLLSHSESAALESLAETTDPNLTFAEKILAALYLKSFIFYPEESEDYFAVFDYTISEELTDDLLVVNVSNELTLRSTIES